MSLSYKQFCYLQEPFALDVDFSVGSREQRQNEYGDCHLSDADKVIWDSLKEGAGDVPGRLGLFAECWIATEQAR